MIQGHPLSSAHPRSLKTLEARRSPQYDLSFHSLIISPISAFCHVRLVGSLSSSLRTCLRLLLQRCGPRAAIAVV